MTDEHEDTPGAIRFSLMGFPVSVESTFFFSAAFLALPLLTEDAGGVQFATWMVAAFASTLVHELGHAEAARFFGRPARIRFYGFGGLTYVDGASLGAGSSMVVSLAGPLFGFAFGALVWALNHRWPAPTGYAFVVDQLLWANVGWGALNLLPILPFDGGTVLRNLMQVVTRRDWPVLVPGLCAVVATVAGAAALLDGWLYPGVLALYFAYWNVSVARRAWLTWFDVAEAEGPEFVVDLTPLRRAASCARGIDRGASGDTAERLFVRELTRDPTCAAVLSACGMDDDKVATALGLGSTEASRWAFVPASFARVRDALACVAVWGRSSEQTVVSPAYALGSLLGARPDMPAIRDLRAAGLEQVAFLRALCHGLASFQPGVGLDASTSAAVVLHNDPFSTRGVVVDALREEAGLDEDEAERLMREVHVQGRGTCGTFTAVEAIAIAEAIMGRAAEAGAPLRASVEALPSRVQMPDM